LARGATPQRSKAVLYLADGPVNAQNRIC
jgi:hypothetical protein